MDAAAEDARDQAFDEGLFALIYADADAVGDVDWRARLCVVEVRRLIVRLQSMAGHLIVTTIPKAEQAEAVAFAGEVLELAMDAALSGKPVPVVLHGEREH